MRKLLITLAVIISFPLATIAIPLKSATLLNITPDNKLLVADAFSGSLYLFNIETSNDQKGFFNIYDLEQGVAEFLKISEESLVIRDMVVHSKDASVYIGIDVFPDNDSVEGLILNVSVSGKISNVHLESSLLDQIKLCEVTEAFRNNLKKQGNQIPVLTDLDVIKNQIVLSRINSQNLPENLLILNYPQFNQPILKTVSENGIYLTALLAERKGKIIGSFSDGSIRTFSLVKSASEGTIPADIITHTMGGETNILKFKKNYLISSQHYSLALLNKKDFKTSSKETQDGSDKFISMKHYPQNGLLDIENYDKKTFLVLKRHWDTGNLDLLSVRKMTKLRLSEFETEYDFPDYSYKGFFNNIIRGMHKKFREDENLTKSQFLN